MAVVLSLLLPFLSVFPVGTAVVQVVLSGTHRLFCDHRSTASALCQLPRLICQASLTISITKVQARRKSFGAKQPINWSRIPSIVGDIFRSINRRWSKDRQEGRDASRILASSGSYGSLMGFSSLYFERCSCRQKTRFDRRGRKPFLSISSGMRSAQTISGALWVLTRGADGELR